MPSFILDANILCIERLHQRLPKIVMIQTPLADAETKLAASHEATSPCRPSRLSWDGRRLAGVYPGDIASVVPGVAASLKLVGWHQSRRCVKAF
jgi:hypothetical protein